MPVEPHHPQPLQQRVTQSKPELLQQAELHEFIDELQLGLAAVHNEISASYFFL